MVKIQQVSNVYRLKYFRDTYGNILLILSHILICIWSNGTHDKV